MKLRLFDIVALIISISIFFLFFMYGRALSSENGYLLIQDESGEYLYPMDADRTITVEGPVGESVIVIEDGAAHFEHSDCKDKLCVLMGDISEGGEWAACLPNRVMILVEGGEDEIETDTLSY
ncbi:MAG: NusG domain II-containing protein [Spirochaetales bacterium]|uniref:NusG domain II-containing protein n=1 Tax=Candidatus Thalassospirochaeta sargassi TaxID=3119039 RepID=A0AAJ1MPU9_9SPIO|nr:NusG domain II-containing protein [Spirochaetales bacterium]